MTWIEITFFVLLFGVFIFGFILDVNQDYGGGPPFFFFLPLFFAILFGLLPVTIVTVNTPTTFVKEEPLKILSNIVTTPRNKLPGLLFELDPKG